ncbi:MAG TPA: amino acid adenylation domain-containing protein [Streptosporangiaceae bacterium]|jgi:amino acid adenylation domain-containing protein
MLTDAQRAALVARLRAGQSGSGAQRITARPAGQDRAPASAGQEQLWFLDRLNPGQPAYNVPCVIWLRGPLDADALCRALDAVAARHEALRTRLVAGPDSRPVQVIDPPPRQVTEVLDYAGDGPEQARRRLGELADAELRRPFDLVAGPLLRAYLVRIAPAEHVLLATVHHAVFDGWSATVLADDLAALYEAEVTGAPPALRELPVQFADYAIWEQRQLREAAREELARYWQRALDGFEILALPTDRPRPQVMDTRGREEHRAVPPALLAGLRELGRGEGTTLFVVLMAAVAALLHRYTGQDDIVVGSTSANRSRAVLAPLIAFLVNTLPVRCDLSGDPAFTELVRRVREATIAAHAHQDLPFASIVEALRVERDASRAPLVQVMFNLVEAPGAGPAAAGVSFEPSAKLAEADITKFDISLFAHTGRDELTLTAVYATALFDQATIATMLAGLEELLRAVAAEPAAPLSRLPVLAGPELDRELARGNDTAVPVPDRCVHEAFEAQAARTPDAVAAQLGGQVVTYAELDRQAGQVAAWLRSAGAGPEVLAGVCMAPSLRRLAVLLGIWKSGAGYLPLDPALPAARLSYMIADAGLKLVIADDGARPALAAVPGLGAPPGPDESDGPDGPGGDSPAGGGTVLPVDAQWATITGPRSCEPPGQGATPGNVAYVIYTSGSTGQPKGVVVEHRQAVSLLTALIDRLGIGPDDVSLQLASLSFDVSVKDMFVPLLAGGKVVLAPPESRSSPRRLAELIRQAGVTFASMTPSVLGLLTGEELPSLRVLVSGGEELPAELARAWQRPGLALYNGYGPTETTVSATGALTGTALTETGPPPIGLPWPNYRAYVLDRYGSPVPPGVVGELHIGGAGVSRGYLGRPGLTSGRFIPDPFSGIAGARMYRTGDLVRRRADGMLVFAGRADGQVKVRGLRMELGEIEAALAACPAVAQAAVTVITDAAGERQLAGYVRMTGGGPADLTALRRRLAATLPGYMIPAFLAEVAEFPLNNSGKIDKAALPAPALAGDAGPAGTGAGGRADLTAPAQALLAGLFGTVLGTAPVGADAGFFEMGGSSLQVMRLVDLVGREAGIDLSVTEVFLHPTPRALAARIDAIRSGGGTGASAAAGPLVPLSQGGGKLPFFLVHAVGGTVAGYASLGQDLGGVFSVQGIQSPVLAGSAGSARLPGPARPGKIAASLAGLADEYAALIRAAQPAGPYRLAGWSMGGVIAFEIARRLERGGARVGALVLLDAPFALPGGPPQGEAGLAGRFLADAAASLGWDLADLPDPASAGAGEQLAWLAARLGGPSGAVPGAAGRALAGNVGTGNAGTGSVGQVGTGPAGDEAGLAGLLRRRFEVFSAHVAMLAGYTASGPAVAAPTLIVTADRSPNAPFRSRWPGVLAGPVATFAVDADHYGFLLPPLVAEVGAAILDWHAGQAEGPAAERAGALAAALPAG